MDRDREKTMSGPGRHLGTVKGKGEDIPLFVIKLKTSKKRVLKKVWASALQYLLRKV